LAVKELGQNGPCSTKAGPRSEHHPKGGIPLRADWFESPGWREFAFEFTVFFFGGQ